MDRGAEGDGRRPRPAAGSVSLIPKRFRGMIVRTHPAALITWTPTAPARHRRRVILKNEPLPAIAVR
jgi:hypothetical protein